MGSALVTLLIIAIIGFFYFLPTFVAYDRKVEWKGWILLANIFFAGTGIVWIILLIWAGSAQKGKEDK